jgi:hypothetical protein
MSFLPNEIINIILSYRGKHPTAIIMENIFQDYNVKEEKNPEFWYDNYSSKFTFEEWYFLYRNWLQKYVLRSKKYHLTKKRKMILKPKSKNSVNLIL